MDSAIVVQEERELVASAPEPRVAADLSNERRVRWLWLSQRRYESQAAVMCCSDETREFCVAGLGFMFNSKGIGSRASRSLSRGHFLEASSLCSSLVDLLAILYYIHWIASLTVGLEKRMRWLGLVGLSEAFAHQMKIFTKTLPEGLLGWLARRFSWLLRRFLLEGEHDGAWCVHR